MPFGVFFPAAKWRIAGSLTERPGAELNIRFNFDFPEWLWPLVMQYKIEGFDPGSE